MRTITIFEHISLDGVIAPGGPNEDSDYANGGWTAPFRSPDGAQALADVQGSGFDLLLGRHTYDLWSGFWPTVTEGPFAKSLNAATKYVVTHRPEGLAWEPAVALGPEKDVVAGVRRLKSGDGPNLVIWGSSTLTPALLEAGLVDGVVLIVYPVLLGRGRRLFSVDADPRVLELVSTKATGTGVILNVYRYVGAPAQG
jgi:dihydrofolate reductase